MSDIVADTHALVWHVFEPHKLSEAARTAFRSAPTIFASTITLVEVCYLCEKGRLPASTLERLLGLFQDHDTGLRTVDVDAELVRTMCRVPRDVVPDMPDRIIAATAASLGLPLISRDAKIRDSQVETIW